MVAEADPIADHLTGVLLGLDAVAMRTLLLERSDQLFNHAFCCGQCGVMNSRFKP